MKKTSIHSTQFGKFAAGLVADSQGFVEIHDSSRYAAATDETLHDWCESRSTAVRNAARAELAQRQIQQWRERDEWGMAKAAR
jgi:hypothetical protein